MGGAALRELTLKLPESLTRLPEAERDLLVRAGPHEATRARIKQVNAESAEAQQEVRRYEVRYGMSLARFEAELLVAADSFQAAEFVAFCKSEEFHAS